MILVLYGRYIYNYQMKMNYFSFNPFKINIPFLCFLKHQEIRNCLVRSSRLHLLLKISQDAQENTCVGVLQACNFIKKRLQHRCFSVKIAKFLRTSFKEHLWWLLLPYSSMYKYRYRATFFRHVLGFYFFYFYY